MFKVFEFLEKSWHYWIIIKKADKYGKSLFSCAGQKNRRVGHNLQLGIYVGQNVLAKYLGRFILCHQLHASLSLSNYLPISVIPWIANNLFKKYLRSSIKYVRINFRKTNIFHSLTLTYTWARNVNFSEIFAYVHTIWMAIFQNR